jgi:SAM-dependent methyltransferase
VSDITAPAARPGALKAGQALAWGAAPFERIAATMADIHDALVGALAPRPGETWLDVATGTGPVALRAARAGAHVTALDLAAPLLETARRQAAAEGLSIRLEPGDCERLPYPDASFDVVASALGVIFASDHAAVAAELARVCRPGGRLGLVSWEPGGGAARMMEISARFQPGPPPPGVGDPGEWGRPAYVAQRLGEAFTLECRRAISWHVAPSAEAVWQLYVEASGPLKLLAASLPPDRRAVLRQAYLDLVAPYGAAAGVRFPREYLLVLGTRRPA